MTEPARAMPELFACERLSARLTVKACGARFLRVRASMPGQQDYDSACDRCPIGEHHAKHGTLCPDTTTQKPATTITKETTTMGAPSEYTDQQKREAVRRVLINNKSQSELATELSVTSTTIRNWIKRWGKDVASDAMEAAAAGSAGTADVAGDVVEEKRQSPPQPSRAAKGPKPSKLKRAAKSIAAPKPKPVPEAWAPFEDERASAAPGHPLAGYDRDTLSNRTLTALKFAREHLVGCVRDMECSQEEIARLETELRAAREELAEHVEAEKLARAMVSLLEGAAGGRRAGSRYPLVAHRVPA